MGTLRDTVIPKATKGQGMTADVGGTTAGYIDLAKQIGDKLPLVIGLVLALSFVLLVAGLPLAAVPLKAVVMNLLSIAAAFGIVTFVFGHHWSATFVGLDGEVPIVSLRAAHDVRDPVRALDGLRGLPHDPRPRALPVDGRSAPRRSSRGSPGPRRVITSAALIMVSVFCAFIINGDPNIKQFGLGMAAAVAVDATIVRCLLVPAVMSLLGRVGLVDAVVAGPRHAAPQHRGRGLLRRAGRGRGGGRARGGPAGAGRGLTTVPRASWARCRGRGARARS